MFKKRPKKEKLSENNLRWIGIPLRLDKKVQKGKASEKNLNPLKREVSLNIWLDKFLKQWEKKSRNATLIRLQPTKT